MIVPMKTVFVTAHLGGGAGKAIIGMACCCKEEMKVSIMILDKPQDYKYVNFAADNKIVMYIQPDEEEQIQIISKSDLLVLNWWNHPLTVRFLQNVGALSCRILLWSHINGCTYPYLPYNFLEIFPKILFTSRYSLNNSLWYEWERKRISEKSDIVYGMGDFQPLNMPHKTNYKTNEKFIVGYIGTINYAKLCPDFLDYCKYAIEKIPEIQFCLVGKPDIEIIEDIRKRGMQDYFRLEGYIEYPDEYYCMFDVFGYLLNSESYATTENSLLEAMAHGLPIIVLKNPVEENIVFEGVNGYLVSDKVEYANKLLELYQSEDKRSKIGRSAREYVVNHYSVSDNCKKFIIQCRNVMLEKRKLYNFNKIIGKTIFEAFCFFCGKDGIDFKKYIEAEVSGVKVMNCKKIFKGNDKASLYQFLKYYPYEIDLIKIAELWEEKI